MTELLRKTLSIALSAAILITAPGLDFGRLWAQGSGAPKKKASEATVQRLTRDGFLKGDKDPLRSYFFKGSGELTPLGEFLESYEILKSSAAADPRSLLDANVFSRLDQDIRTSLEEVRQSPQVREGLAEKRKVIEDLAARLKGMGLGSPENAYMAVSQMMAVLTGARQVQGKAVQEDLAVVYIDDTAEYYDSKGRLYGIVDKQGNILRSREIEDRQIAFNKQNIPGAPRLAVTGVLDVPTLLSPCYEFGDQLKKLDRSYHYDRTYSLAEILHKDKQYAADQFDPDIQKKELKNGKTLEEQMEEEKAGGSQYRAKELLDPLFDERSTYLKRAQDALADLKRTVEGFRGKGAIPESKVKAVELKQREIGRLVTLAYLSGEMYHMKHAKSKLFCKDMQEALKKAPGSKQEKAQYEAQRPKLQKRMEAVAIQIERIKKQLDALALNLPLGDPRLDGLMKKMEALSYLLANVQVQSQQVLEDFNLYATVLGQNTASDKISDSGWAANTYNWFAKKLAPKSETARQAKTIEEGTLTLSQAAASLGSGDYLAAKAKLKDLVPGAISTHWNASLSGGSAEPTDSDRMNASLQAYSEVLTKKSKRDFWVNLGGDLILGAAITAVAAPLAGSILTGVGSKLVATAAEIAITGGRVARAAAPLVRGVGEVMINSGALLSNLSNKKWVPNPFNQSGFATRMFNAVRMEAAVSANLGLISGAMQAWKAGDPNSPFKDRAQAFKEGFKGGAQFMIEKPYLLYVGLPATVFGRGNAVTRALSNYGESGLVGGTSRTVSNFFKADVDLVGKAAGLLQKGGAAGQFGSFMVGTADQVAKYYFGAEAMGWAAKRVVYYESKAMQGSLFDPERGKLTDEKLLQVRQRIDRAERAALFTMNWGWLLIPTAPAAGMKAREDQILSENGYWEYKASNKIHEMVNAEGRTLPMATIPKPSLLEVVFGRYKQKGPAEQTVFKVTKEMDVKATREVIRKNAPTLQDLFALTQIKDGDPFGPLKPKSTWKNPNAPERFWSVKGSDKVRDQAQLLFEEVALKNPGLARELLRAGDSALKQEIARIYLDAYPEGGLFQRVTNTLRHWKNTLRPSGDGLRAGVLEIGKGLSRESLGSKRQAMSDILVGSKEILKTHLETEANVNAKAEILLGHVVKKGAATPAYEAAIQSLVSETNAWREAKDKNTGPEFSEVLNAWNAKAQSDAQLTASQKQTLGALTEYVGALQDRFTRAEIRDAKGTRITSFRPKQTQVFIQFLAKVALAGPAKDGVSPGGLLKRVSRKAQGGEMTVTEVSRNYLLLATGGGKTLLAFEGILPIAKADAQAKGKKLVYMTANSNLVAQARVDYKAFKKILTKLELITMDEFTTRVAKGRFMGGDRAQDYWLMADELDKMAEDAVKTIGQESSQITRQNDAYRGLENLSRKIQDTVTRIGETPTPGFGSRLKRTARFWFGDLVGSVTPGEMGVKLRSDLKELRTEHRRLLAEAQTLHASDVRRFQEAISAKKADPKSSPLSTESLQKALEGAEARYRVSAEKAQQLQTIVERMGQLSDAKNFGWEKQLQKESERYQSLVPEGAPAELSQLGREARNLVKRAGGTGHEFSGAGEKFEALLARQDKLLEQAPVDAAVKAELRASLESMGGLVGSKQAALDLKRLAQEYRRTLPQAIDSRQPLYEAFGKADSEIARWMDSPLRRTNGDRVEWVEEIKAIGKDAQQQLETPSSGKPEAGKDLFGQPIKDSGAREAVVALLKRQGELLDRAEKKTGNVDPAQLELFPAGKLSPVESSPYQIRDRAKAAELRTTLAQMAEIVMKGGSKEDLKKLADRYQTLVPEALVSVNWEAAFEKSLDGMTKKYADKFIQAVKEDPYMSSSEKGKLLAEFYISKFTGKGWVRQELMNLAYARQEDPAKVRYDSQAKKVFVVHVGEWFENMDTPTRRYWELKYKTDLTLPYEHRAKATVRDITANAEMNYVAFSGTKQEKLDLKNTNVVGDATPVQLAKPGSYSTSSQMYQNALRQVKGNLQSPTTLTFIGFANTRDLKLFKELLRRSGVAKESIAQIFSDSEFLRTQRPNADVVQQMNLANLKTGKVKVVLVDMLVGGRGLDLDFKSFGKDKNYQGAGYRDIEMIIFNPYKMSPGHYVQFQGRIAPDRVASGVKPRYYNYIDLAEAARDPKLRELAKEEGVPLDADFIVKHLDDVQKAVQQELLENSEAIMRGHSYWRTGLHGLTK